MASKDDDEKKEANPIVNANAKEIEVDYDTIDDKQLIEKLKKNASEVLIIDARDPDPEEGDYIGGNIKGAVNIPSFDFVDKLPEIITSKNLEEKKTIIFTCMMSKGRGPQIYKLYNKARDTLTKDADKGGDDAKKDDEFSKIVSTIKLDDKCKTLLKDQKAFVLKGGFHGFLNYNKDTEKDLIENYNEKYWEVTQLQGDDNEGLALYHTNEQ
mmetsp:Transcript_5643/g.4932  ORF Transcript_5643/g.4932 Transcript_5643/m.4932 type:complete len:212 (-) Transcript_5643:206-841(-)|eukprot:CAMPEP_0201577818 /NCGR_PEP_ID=MMETSP0190_2-20130828/24364_1 /ASSEMBLY_ACC=CAM_ASM_000263 /TAXON_ID=37353 /ORGANISM="Rosalina sp." /LENGTH=211 /DNA_ID=CAMNT_0048010265 /DNA_START=81 /DNA_END=716 /DNA_ORIENTATION=-